ncbi:hypothetical protein BDR07DRAFT_1553702 [Suillus spraguei]|nr:hypothetical protein BDR07DRAFT_1553702 [Suillus spraguei]
MTGVGYGVVFALFSLWHRTRVKDADYTRNCFFLVYICVMFTLGSLFFGSNSQFTQLAFIDDRNFPGGPSAWEVDMFSISVDEISNVSFVLADWCATALMVWRCVIIYRDCGHCPWPILVLLGTMLLLSFGKYAWHPLSSSNSSPLSSPYSAAGTSVNFTFPYFFFELATNIVVTILIVLRLYFYRRHMKESLLGPGHVAEHTSVESIIVESAAIYSTFSLLFFDPIRDEESCCQRVYASAWRGSTHCPFLIIFREAQGNGWISSALSAASSSRTAFQFSDIEFTSRHLHNQGLKSTDVSMPPEEGLDIDNGDNIAEVPRMEDCI